MTVEWAVIQNIFRGTQLIKGGLGDQEEAEQWCAALETTRKRANHEHFMRTDGLVLEEQYEIGWRYVDHWHSPEEEPE